MSKNRRKSLKKEPVIPKRTFRFTNRKIYINCDNYYVSYCTACICYDGRKRSIITVTIFFLMMLNPMFIALSGLIYGIKQGFNFKFRCL